MELPPTTHRHPGETDLHWDQVRPPWWWHTCRAQCAGVVSGETLIERCACGAIRGTDIFTGVCSGWYERNSRRIRARSRHVVNL